MAHFDKGISATAQVSSAVRTTSNYPERPGPRDGRDMERRSSDVRRSRIAWILPF